MHHEIPEYQINVADHLSLLTIKMLQIFNYIFLSFTVPSCIPKYAIFAISTNKPVSTTPGKTKEQILKMYFGIQPFALCNQYKGSKLKKNLIYYCN